MRGYLCRHRGVAWAVAAGLALRGGFLLYYLSTHGWQGETWEYEVIARNLLEGRGFVYESVGCAYRSYVVPVFPLVCAFLHWVGGAGLGLFYSFHLAVAVGVMVLTYLLAERWLGKAAAVWAVWFVALEPGLILYQSYKVDVGPLACLLLLAFLHGFLRLRESGGGSRAVAIGLAWGIGMLARPDLLAAGMALLCWMIVEAGKPRVRRAGAVVLAVAALTLTPWVARNYAVHRRLVPFSTMQYWICWLGNNPYSRGTLVVEGNSSVMGAVPERLREDVLSSDEIERMDFFRGEVFRYVREHPGDFVSGVARKFWYFWWFSPTLATKHYEWVPKWMVGVYRFGHVLALALTVVGLYRALRGGSEDSRWLSAYLLAVPLAQSAIHSLFFTELRHRLLIMPLLLILAAHGWTAVLGFLGRGETSRPPAGEPGAGLGPEGPAV